VKAEVFLHTLPFLSRELCFEQPMLGVRASSRIEGIIGVFEPPAGWDRRSGGIAASCV